MFDYTIASLIAMFPATLAEVYFGTAMKDLGDVVNGDIKGSAIGRTFFWIGISITFIVTIFVTLWLRQKLNNELVKYHYVNISSNRDNASTDDQPALNSVVSPVLSENVKRMELEDCVQGQNGCDEQSFSNPSVFMSSSADLHLSAEKSFVDPEVVDSMTEMHV